VNLGAEVVNKKKKKKKNDWL